MVESKGLRIRGDERGFKPLLLTGMMKFQFHNINELDALIQYN